mmetsp:Transcript_407/g.991  ORF Transcript_407/g.991 Transcript_407/m.991 type:complete len:133 (+) Transcript_407:392-790(+)
MTKEHKSLMQSKCSKRKSVAMPLLPEEAGGEIPISEGGQNRTGGDSPDPIPVNDPDDEQEEQWDVIKVMSMKDLEERQIVCNGDSCSTVAAVVYRSNLKPTEKWYSCLDCQVRYCSERDRLVVSHNRTDQRL